jgi:hypothetical protein
MKNSASASKYRWNSSRASNSTSAKANSEGGFGRGARAGWNTFSVVTLVAATAALAHGFATYQANEKAARQRNYSSPDKFAQTKYASVGDMETVSTLIIIVKCWKLPSFCLHYFPK